MSAVTVRILRSAEELGGITPAWWSLWRRVPAATPFQSPAWLVPWWRHFHPGDLFVVAAERERELIGLAPLYVESSPSGRRLLPIGISLSDYLDILLDPDWASAAGAAVADGLRADGSWDRLDLEELRPGAAAFGLPFAPAAECTPQSACPTLVLAADLDATLPKPKRRKLNLARNRAARGGATLVARAQGLAIGPALDHLFRLHTKRWRLRGEKGVLADEPVRRFHHEAAAALAAAGMLRLYSLEWRGAVVAALYGFHQGSESYAYLAGFDPDHEFESPGVILMAHVIEAALAEGAATFHFLRGREGYKYSWGAVDRWNQRLTFVRGSSRDAAA